MPDIKLTQVMSFSSEDPNFPASNLLDSERFKKWKSKSAGEKEVFVMVKFESSARIDAVHIGNEGSALVEVLVGKLGADVKDFQVLLPTSSFMSPAESRTGTNASRVRLFERDRLSAAADTHWECARIVCTQPFCRTSAYGLAFVRLRGTTVGGVAAGGVAAGGVPADGVAAGGEGERVTPLRLGTFTVRPETTDDIKAGGLFNRRAKLAAAGVSRTGEDRTGREVPPLAGGSLTAEDRADRVVPPRHPAGTVHTSTAQPPSPTGHYQLKPDTNKNWPARATAATSQGKPATPQAKRGKPETKPATLGTKPATSQAKPATSHTKPARPEAGPARPYNKEARPKTKPSDNGPAAASTARPPAASNADTAEQPARPPATAIYRPFDKLLAGVVFALSGYQNPERSDLRECAIRLGAKYRPAWGTGCTHLICAFRNTPKFAEVRGRAKIVTGQWILACTRQKRRLSWRRYALEAADGRSPDSDDELWAEELRPRQPTGAPPPPPAGDEYGGSTDEIDTDDEIRMAEEESVQTAAAAPGKSPAPNHGRQHPTSAAVPSSSLPAAAAPSPAAAPSRRSPPSPAVAPASAAPSRRSPSLPAASPAKRSSSTQAVGPGGGDAVAKKQRRRSPPAATPPKRAAAAVDDDSDAAYDADTDEDEDEAEAAGERRPDTTGLRVPELPELFRGRTFLLYGEAMSSESRRQSARCIAAFGGKLEQYFVGGINYVITSDAWDSNFDEAVADHPEVMFARPAWLEACFRQWRFVPPQPYLVVADL